MDVVLHRPYQPNNQLDSYDYSLPQPFRQGRHHIDLLTLAHVNVWPSDDVIRDVHNASRSEEAIRIA